MATHVFQPLGSTSMRLGQVGQVHNAMFNFNKAGELEWVFDGGSLLKGETDGSSYMNGGMRVTHTAGGYTAIDPTSPVFIRGDTMCIPTVFVSWHGDALDEKTPLLRSMKAINEQGKRLCSLMGYSVSGVVPNIGLEQEFFLIPRSAYYKRPDLQLTGRTIIGKSSARGQEMCDHYMAAPNEKALACMETRRSGESICEPAGRVAVFCSRSCTTLHSRCSVEWTRGIAPFPVGLFATWRNASWLSVD